MLAPIKQQSNELLHPRVSDGYLNATAMCKRYGKLLGNWLNNKSTDTVLEALSSDIGIPISEIIQVQRGGNSQQQGTWIHPDLAIQLAQWLDPAFAIQVSRLVRDWFANQGNHPTPQLPQTYEESLEQLLDTVRQKKQLEQKLEESQPKLAAYKQLIDADGVFSIADTAKMLGTGQRRLFNMLRLLAIIKKDNIPYQNHIDAGRFVVKTSTYSRNGEVSLCKTTLVTGRGIAYLHKKLKGLLPYNGLFGEVKA